MTRLLFSLLLLWVTFFPPGHAREEFFVVEESNPFQARNWYATFGSYSLEREFENDEEVVDQKDDKALFFEVGKGFRFGEKISFEVAVNFEVRGRSEHRFADDVNLENRYYHYDGLRAVRTRLIYNFQSNSERDQAILIEAMGLADNARDGSSRMPGLDLGLSYMSRWYIYDSFFTQAHLKAMFFGKKDIHKKNGEKESTDPYSIVEFQGSTGFRTRHWLFVVTPGFGLTNDYNISSPSYSHSSDKGFTVHIRAALAYINDGKTYEFSHTRRSHVFNNVADRPVDEIDFEIESEATTLEIIWAF